MEGRSGKKEGKDTGEAEFLSRWKERLEGRSKIGSDSETLAGDKEIS